jgi:hypothetical protein
MGKNIENFRDQLGKLAEAVEILENTFINNGDLEIKVSLDKDTFISLISHLNNKSKDDRCVISIGNANFTFSKK